MRRLEGKVAIVTGGGSGIGRASARMMAVEGARVVVAGRRPESLDETVRLIEDDGGGAVAVRADVTKVPDLQEMVRIAVETYGKVDVLHSNAGTLGPKGLDIDEDQWNAEVDVNLRAAFFATKFVAPEMRKAGGGSIIFTSSTSGISGSWGSPVYSATRGGVVMMAKSLALVLARHKIRVNAICPGPTNTPLTFQAFDRTREPDPEAVSRWLQTATPLGRIGEPREIAAAAVFLASDESSFITGVALPVDGGLTAQTGRFH